MPSESAPPSVGRTMSLADKEMKMLNGTIHRHTKKKPTTCRIERGDECLDEFILPFTHLLEGVPFCCKVLKRQVVSHKQQNCKDEGRENGKIYNSIISPVPVPPMNPTEKIDMTGKLVRRDP